MQTDAWGQGWEQIACMITGDPSWVTSDCETAVW